MWRLDPAPGACESTFLVSVAVALEQLAFDWHLLTPASKNLVAQRSMIRSNISLTPRPIR